MLVLCWEPSSDEVNIYTIKPVSIKYQWWAEGGKKIKTWKQLKIWFPEEKTCLNGKKSW